MNLIHNCLNPIDCDLDHRNLDNVFQKDPESPSSLKLRTFLAACEQLAHHWNIIKVNRFKYRLTEYSWVNHIIDRIPRTTDPSSIMNYKTLHLSQNRLFMIYGDSDKQKLYIGKDYTFAAAKLNLAFHNLLDLFTALKSVWKPIREAKKIELQSGM